MSLVLSAGLALALLLGCWFGWKQLRAPPEDPRWQALRPAPFRTANPPDPEAFAIEAGVDEVEAEALDRLMEALIAGHLPPVGCSMAEDLTDTPLDPNSMVVYTSWRILKEAGELAAADLLMESAAQGDAMSVAVSAAMRRDRGLPPLPLEVVRQGVLREALCGERTLELSMKGTWNADVERRRYLAHMIGLADCLDTEDRSAAAACVAVFRPPVYFGARHSRMLALQPHVVQQMLVP